MPGRSEAEFSWRPACIITCWWHCGKVTSRTHFYYLPKYPPNKLTKKNLRVCQWSNGSGQLATIGLNDRFPLAISVEWREVVSFLSLRLSSLLSLRLQDLLAGFSFWDLQGTSEGSASGPSHFHTCCWSILTCTSWCEIFDSPKDSFSMSKRLFRFLCCF